MVGVTTPTKSVSRHEYQPFFLLVFCEFFPWITKRQLYRKSHVDSHDSSLHVYLESMLQCCFIKGKNKNKALTTY